jgi:hypothetical protein
MIPDVHGDDADRVGTQCESLHTTHLVHDRDARTDEELAADAVGHHGRPSHLDTHDRTVSLAAVESEAFAWRPIDGAAAIGRHHPKFIYFYMQREPGTHVVLPRLLLGNVASAMSLAESYAPSSHVLHMALTLSLRGFFLGMLRRKGCLSFALFTNFAGAFSSILS